MARSAGRCLILAAMLVALPGCRDARPARSPHGKIVIEVSVFQGGFGIDYYQSVAREYERLHPNVEVNLWGDPRNADKIRPRFVAGNPPDLVFADVPVWTLAVAGQVYPLDKVLDSPAYGQPDKTWRETLVPGSLDVLKMDGHNYGLLVEYGTSGFWYNVKMFRKYGWPVPKTWDRLLDICEKAKQHGIDPIAFQGRYVGYMMIPFEDLVIRIGGVQAWANLQNMRPGAWTSPAAVKAATFIYDLRRKQYIRDSYMGLSHLESQMKFVQGQAAMVTCGTQLKNEMRSSTPAGFEMAFFPTPVVKGGKGDPDAVFVAGNPWFVPAAARHPELGADFLKFLTSLDHAKRFARHMDALISVKGADTGLPPELESAAQCLRSAHFTYTTRIMFWYLSFTRTHYNEALSNLMNLRWTPKQFCEYLEKAAEQLRSDNRVRKLTLPVPGTEAKSGKL